MICDKGRRMEQHGKKAVIFDLDGTLADSINSIAYSMNRALEKAELPTFSNEEYKKFVGDGADILIKRCLTACGDVEWSNYSRVYEAYQYFFEKDCMYQVCAYEGIQELLGELKSRGCKLAVLSNKPHERTVDVVNSLFGEGYFDFVQGQVKDIPKKPSPAGVFHILKQLCMESSELVYVGDTGTDMKTGKDAGVFTVGVLWGFRDREELEDNQADVIISHPLELLDFCQV